MQEFDKSEIEILETVMSNREVYDLFINILNYVYYIRNKSIEI